MKHSCSHSGRLYMSLIKEVQNLTVYFIMLPVLEICIELLQFVVCQIISCDFAKLHQTTLSKYLSHIRFIFKCTKYGLIIQLWLQKQREDSNAQSLFDQALCLFRPKPHRSVWDSPRHRDEHGLGQLVDILFQLINCTQAWWTWSVFP